ncbi:hypothetical protein RJ639_023322 [Escallonia herrerae]|uniref:Integrase catalytic domain-containing protein n=1 Tax=Escallonia herrerae TaxID=1293975 RepID=A0AA88UYK3_9ASTE|nr:hypothetical protein RJ639_023322 [Escallonia herrerae]
MNASEWAILDRKALTTKIREPHYGITGWDICVRVVLRLLHSKNALPGMKNIQLDFCEGCVYGKQKRASFQRDGKKKLERLELVHTDVCGPTTVKSLGGNFYFVSFMDDASKMTWIYVIRQKSDIYHTFKKWKALVKNEIGNKIKCLKYDNGGEYRDGGFQEYCSNNDIRLIRIVKRIPQENGLAERMNITIMERARCMGIHVDLPLQFWAAAVDTVVYLINGSPASALNGGIPEEEWSAHFKLSKELSPKNREDEEYMARVPYTSVVGSLMYAMVNTRFCLRFKGDNIDVRGYVDVDHVEAEYATVTEVSKEIIWLYRLLTELGYGQVDCKLWTDSQSTIHLTKKSAFHSGTKHIELRYHFIRSLLEDGQLNLEKIEGNKNPADMLTKVVDRQKLSLYSTLISLR